MAPIEQLLGQWLEATRAKDRARRPGETRGGARETLFARWQDVVGDEIAASTRVIDVRAGELIIEVASAALLNELATYYKAQILESLRDVEGFRGIHEIRFRAGSFAVDQRR